MSSALIEAIRLSATDRVIGCLLLGADPNFIEDSEGVTPLHHAAQFDNCDVVEALIMSGASIFSETTYERLTPIEVACLNKNWTVAAMLAHHQQYLYLICLLARYCEY